MLDETQSIINAINDLAKKGDKNAKKMYDAWDKSGLPGLNTDFQKLNESLSNIAKKYNDTDPAKRLKADIAEQGMSQEERAIYKQLSLQVLKLQQTITGFEFKSNESLENTKQTIDDMSVSLRAQISSREELLKKYFDTWDVAADQLADVVAESAASLTKLKEDLQLVPSVDKQELERLNTEIKDITTTFEEANKALTALESLPILKQRAAISSAAGNVAASALADKTAYDRKTQLYSIFGMTPEKMKQTKDELVGFLSSPFAIAVGAVKVLIGLMGTLFDLTMATRSGVSQAATLGVDFAKNYMSALRAGIILTPGDAAEIQAALVEQFGSIKIDKGMFTNVAQLTRFGVNAGDAATFVRQLDLAVGKSAALRNNTINYVSSLAKANAIPIGRLYADLAKNSELVARAGEKNAQSLARAAVAAAKMGVELSSIDTAASALTDFESSIQSEAQFKSLTGAFGVDFTKARQYALGNDLDSLRKELHTQLSGINYGQLNRIQQNALAQTLGLSGRDLTRLISGATVEEGNGQGIGFGENAAQSIAKMAEKVNFTALAVAALAAAASLASFTGRGILGGLGGLLGGARGAIGAGGAALASGIGPAALASLKFVGTAAGGIGTAYNIGSGISSLAGGHTGQGIGTLLGTGIGGLAGLIGGGGFNPVTGLLGASIGGGIGGQIGKLFDSSENSANLETATAAQAAEQQPVQIDTNRLESKFEQLTTALLSGQVSVNIDGRKLGVLLADMQHTGRSPAASYVKPVA